MIIGFIYLGILNLADAFVTFYGLSINVIEELNPIMRKLYGINPLLFLSTKILLTISLFALIKYKKIPETRLFICLSLISALAYTYICGKHVLWFVMIL